MKYTKFLIFIVIFLIAAVFINANEMKNIKQDKSTVMFNFEKTRVLDNAKTVFNNSLKDKGMVEYAIRGSKRAKSFLWLGIAGIAVNVIGLSMIIPGTVLLTLDYFGRFTYNNPGGRAALLAGAGVLVGMGSLLFIGGAAMFIVGIVLFHYYGGRFTMFNTTNYKNCSLDSGFSVKFN